MRADGWLRVRERPRRAIVEDCLSLNIAVLKKLDLFQPGYLVRRPVEWNRDGSVVAMGMVAVVLYKNKHGPHVILDVLGLQPQIVFLTYTRPRCGGRRWWFICPSGQRCATLHLTYRGKYFLCRQAAELRYYTQRLGKSDRVIEAARRMRRNLEARGWSELSGARPKGMWRRTYEANMKQFDERRQRARGEFMQYASRVVGGKGRHAPRC